MKNKAIVIIINAMLFTVSPAFAMDRDNEEFTSSNHLKQQARTIEEKERKLLLPIRVKESQTLSGKETLRQSFPLVLSSLDDEGASPPKELSPQISPTFEAQMERKVSKTIPLERRRRSSGSLKGSSKSPSLSSISVSTSPKEEKISPRIEISPRKDISPRTNVAPKNEIFPLQVDKFDNLSVDSSTLLLISCRKTRREPLENSRKVFFPRGDQDALTMIMEQIVSASQHKTKESCQSFSDSSGEEFLERDSAPLRQRKESIITQEKSLERVDD